MFHRPSRCPAIIAAALLAALLAGALPAQARSATCPAAGARYESNNFVRTSSLVSLGGDRDDTLGCRWRREDDGQILWLDPDSPTMRPLGPAGPATDQAAPAPPAPEAAGDISGAIQAGVYECDAPASVGGMTLRTPSTGLMFGVIGPGAYRDFDGGRGSFRMEGNILVMSSGPLNGTRYRRDGATLFSPLDAGGRSGSIRCVLNRARSVDGRW